MLHCPSPGGAVHVDYHLGGVHCRRVEGGRSGLVMGEGSALLPDCAPFFLPSAPRSKVSLPLNRAQTSSNWCGLQRPILCLGLAAFFCDGAHRPLQAPPCSPAVEAASRVALSLFLAGPISQKMYAMLPCGGIGVSRAPASRDGWMAVPALALPFLPTMAAGPLSRCPPPFLPSPCRGHPEACSPAPAGGQ